MFIRAGSIGLLILFSTTLLAATDDSDSLVTLYQVAQKKLAVAKANAATAQTKKIQMNAELTEKLFSPYGTSADRQIDIINWYQMQPDTAAVTLGGMANLFFYSRKIGGSTSTESGVDIHEVDLSMVTHYRNATAVLQVGNGPDPNIFLGDLSYTYGGSSGNSYQAQAFDVDQAYAMITTDDQHFYLLVGRKDIDSGQFSKVTTYNNPLTRQFFMARGTEVSLGFQNSHLTFNGSLVDNTSSAINLPNEAALGREKRTLDNYALSLTYRLFADNSYNVTFTTGYLAQGDIAAYNNLNSDGNAIVSSYPGVANIGMTVKIKALMLISEYVTTVSKATVHSADQTTTELSDGSKVSAYNVGFDYQLPNFESLTLFSASHFAASYSRLYFNAQGFSPSEAIYSDLGSAMSRWAVEWRKPINQHWMVSLDYLDNNASWTAVQPENFNQQKIFIAGVNVFF